MYNLMKSKRDAVADSAVAFAQKLIQTPSLSLHEGAVADLVEQEMRRLRYDKVFRDNAGNVIGVLHGREAEPALLLNAHMDTVSPGPEDRWSHPPYGGRIENGRLHGLGAADCKGGLAGLVYAGALLKSCLLPLRGSLVVAATATEENGCSVGVRQLAAHTLPEMGLMPTYAILGEPTGLGLYYGHDGWVELDIQVEGANPFLVDDAAQAIYANYTNGAADPRESLVLHRPLFETSAGCRRATIQMDRRLHPSDNVGALMGRIRQEASQAAHGTGSVAVAVAVRHEQQQLYNGQTTMVRRLVHAWSTDPFHPLMERARQALAAADCRVRPGKWDLRQVGMGTAGSVLTQEFAVPTIGYGPGVEEMAHAANESIEIGRLTEAVYGTAAIAHSLIGVPVFGWTADEI